MAARADLLASSRLMKPAAARAYVGGIGREAFARDVAPFVGTVRIGQRTFYDRADLDRWVDEKTGRRQPSSRERWLEALDRDLGEIVRDQADHS